MPGIATDWIARRVCKYMDLVGDAPDRRPWVLTGDIVGNGPDHEPLVTGCPADPTQSEVCPSGLGGNSLRMSVSGETPDHVDVDEADELRAEIVATRAELADTIDQLVAKADVKTRARRQLTDTKRYLRAHATELAYAGAGLVAVVVLVMVRRG